MQRHRNLIAALQGIRSTRMRGTKILLSDDGSFSLHFCPGQDPNFLDVEGDQAEGRQIMHRYIRTGLATMGMRIYVLHEVVGADVSELLSDLGRARTPATEEWRESDFEAGTSWMNGHRLGRRDRGFTRGTPTRRVAAAG